MSTPYDIAIAGIKDAIDAINAQNYGLAKAFLVEAKHEANEAFFEMMLRGIDGQDEEKPPVVVHKIDPTKELSIQGQAQE